jgi:16S rRNA (guanine1516-N2)-methyltransferase
MYERSPIVHALLADGLQRGATADAAVAAVIPNLQLRNFNFDATIKLDQSVDVVYLDPMFPESKRSARVKKDMYLLQRLLGGEQQARSKQENQRDEFNLLDAAKNIAEKRVVVKRGKASPYMGACKPDVEFKGSSNRYDVYLSV